jgi:DNA-binding FadR family transcriptional regulator
MSKYGDLAAALRSAIESGAYGAGERLPTTPELCEIYHVSNTTVKKALDELGWKAELGIEEMCASSWKWQSMNPNGYRD